MLNLGARGDHGRGVSTAEVLDALDVPDDDAEAWAVAERQAASAAQWAEERATDADASISLPDATARLLDALRGRDAPDAVRSAVSIYNARLHPTARSIVAGAAEQAVYSLTGGERLHTFEPDEPPRVSIDRLTLATLADFADENPMASDETHDAARRAYDALGHEPDGAESSASEPDSEEIDARAATEARCGVSLDGPARTDYDGGR